MKVRIVCLALWILGSARIAAAHDVRGEVVLLDIGEHAVDVEARASAQQLGIARGAPLGANPAATVIAQQRELAAYAARAIGAHSADGRAFAGTAGPVSVGRDGDGDVVVFRVHLVAPPGATARWFALHDDLVLGKVTTANVYVFVRSDPQGGIIDGDPALLGYLHYQQRALVVDRRDGSLARAFGSVFKLGVRHIASGTDHRMFLLMLLVPAPLLARRTRWARPRDTRSTIAAMARVVSAFTVGHSLTLLIGAVFGAVVPVAIVESLIAVSIVVTAAHAVRPLFPGREAAIAGAFGLVHGLAFAATLAGVGVDRVSLAIGLLGFNLGVEVMQLAILLLAIPWLLVLARHAIYRPFRIAAAGATALAAGAWLAERALGVRTPIPALVERAAAHSVWGLAALAVTALGLTIASARRGGRGSLAGRESAA